ncbi:S8 family serine peptidase, partial [Bacillus cereus group sp. Bce009]|uniref:S8 family serine peptidase n=1 Tax=Bacillus cereus group sp. Bce009 TaxID=3445252 RepID=UPI003F24CFCB
MDDIHGFDFHGNKGKIDADDHGSHVAGTVAARNNNGIGVCGVAGGDGKPGTGVRIMTCQMFTGKASGGAATAMKYQADNGA